MIVKKNRFYCYSFAYVFKKCHSLNIVNAAGAKPEETRCCNCNEVYKIAT